MQVDANRASTFFLILTVWPDAGSNSVSKSAAKLSPDRGAATSSSALASDSQDSLDPKAEPLPLALATQERRSKTAIPSKPKRPFGLTTLAALRQRPQPTVLRHKEAKASTAKAQPLQTSQLALAQQPSSDTVGSSSTAGNAPTVDAGNAAELAVAEPRSALTPSNQNLAQPEAALEAVQADQSTPPANEPAASGSEASADDAGEATSPVYLPPKPQPKLNKKQRRAQQRDQAAVDDDSAGPSSSGAADMAWSDAESATPALPEEAIVTQSSLARLTQSSQPQQTQQDDSSQLLHSAGSARGISTVWGTLDTLTGASSGQMNNERFPPLSQADSSSESAMRPAAGSADYSAHADEQELSVDAFMAGAPIAASIGESSVQQTQQEDCMSTTAVSSRQAERAEHFAESSSQAEADVMQTPAGSSALTAMSVPDDDAAAASAEAAVVAAHPVFGQRIAGRGPFQLSSELQMALSGKPKPGRAKAKADMPLPEPSADLILQRALMEKPKPRPRPRRPRVTPQSTGNVLESLHLVISVTSVSKHKKRHIPAFLLPQFGSTVTMSLSCRLEFPAFPQPINVSPEGSLLKMQMQSLVGNLH